MENSKHYITMKNQFKKASLALVAGIAVMSCSVDNSCDLSKDVDMTVAVGNGLSIPLGSSEAIMLTEMIDPEKSDVLNVTEDGSYVIEKNGTFDAVDFRIDEVNGVHIDTEIEEQHYSMDLKELFNSYDDAIAAINNDPYLPEDVKKALIAELDAHKVPVSLDEHIDKNDILFDFSKDGLPEEVNRIYRVEFDKPVRMHLAVDVLCQADQALFELMDSLELSTAGDDDEHFYVCVPEYIEFVENEYVDGNKLYLEGAVHVTDDHSMFTMGWDFYIKALNFKNGYEIENGIIALNEKLDINGSVKSNMVMVEAGDLVDGCRTFEDVVFRPSIAIDEFDIKHIEAQVDVDIDDINETIDIDLGNDLDFLYEDGTVLDFANPQLVVNIENHSVVSVASDVIIKGYDENGTFIDGSEVFAHLDIKSSSDNHFFITNTGENKEGYVAVKSDLSNLFRKLPHTIGFEMKSDNDAEEHVDIYLGSKMDVSGDYSVNIPLEFNDVALTYTETIEDVLGDDSSEITDYVKNVDLITMDIEVANTVPAGFTPVVVAKDADGKELKGISVSVEGCVASGNGMSGGKVTDPVMSGIKVLLSAKDNELVKLNTIDLKLVGVGKGTLNTNEYIKIEKMTINIEKPVEVDLN